MSSAHSGNGDTGKLRADGHGLGSPVADLDAALARLESRDQSVEAFYPEADRRGRLANQVADLDWAGPLAGLLVGVKDLFRVDGMATTAGSVLHPELFDGPQSAVVSRLRAAGAVIAGKTALDEFAWSEPPTTKNPRDPARTPGGSSGGSAAAVAADLVPLAIGSQSMHSTITPASYCGVFGLATSFGRIAFDGVPLAPTIDTVGFLGVDLSVIGSALSASVPDWRPVDPGAPVIGVCEPWGVRRLHTEAWSAFRHHVRALKEAGWECRSVRTPWTEEQVSWGQIAGDLQRAEFASVHRDWFARFGHLYRPGTTQGVARGAQVSPERLTECRTQRADLVAELERVTEAYGIDCWICPSGRIAPLAAESTGDSWMACFWAFAGWPAVSLPIFDGEAGLPHGLQVVAPHGRDEELLAWAEAIIPALRQAQPPADRPAESQAESL